MEEKTSTIKRIALIGPECTAKSTLSKELAIHYKTFWVAEYARKYLADLNRKYTLHDIQTIAKLQLEQEEQLIQKANKFLFSDTELIINKVWCIDVFKTCPDWITSTIIEKKYDLYLLTFPDLPWKEDVLRENPYRREFLFNWYEQELINISANYYIIKGAGEVRLQNCIKSIENNFNIK